MIIMACSTNLQRRKCLLFCSHYEKCSPLNSYLSHNQHRISVFGPFLFLLKATGGTCADAVFPALVSSLLADP